MARASAGAGLERAGPALAAGPKGRGAAHFKNENSFSFSFSFLKTAHKNAFWSIFQTFSRKVRKQKLLHFSCSTTLLKGSKSNSK
jgi:hypothetical protein